MDRICFRVWHVFFNYFSMFSEHKTVWRRYIYSKRRNALLMWFSPFTEPTAITSPAGHLDVTVGESIVLPCQVSHDPTLDLKFTWFFNEQLIHFGSQWAHFEKVGGVSATILSAPFTLFHCNLVSVYFDYSLLAVVTCGFHKLTNGYFTEPWQRKKHFPLFL